MTIVRDKVPGILSAICKTDEVAQDLELDLFATGLLDSFGIIEFLISCEEQLDILVPITEFDRLEWRTANRIIVKLEERL